jgi:hypothetical protein
MPNAGTVCRFAWPVEITSATRGIRATINGVAATVNIAVGTYWWFGDGSANDLCTRLDTALTSHPQAPVIVVALNADGTITITSSLSIVIDFAHADTTIDAATFGFVDGVSYSDLAAPFVITSPNQVGHLWNPERIYCDDTGLVPQNTVSRSVDLSGAPTAYRWSSVQIRDITIDLIPFEKLLSADSPVSEAFDLFYSYISQGNKFVWTPDITAPATWTTYYLRDVAQLESWPWERIAEVTRYHRVTLRMQLTTWGA